MPELPEVETIKSVLQPVLVGQVIKQIIVLEPKTVKPARPADFKKKLIGRQINYINRQAKMILIGLTDDNFLIIHLKMTGQLIYTPPIGRPIFGGHPQPGGLDNLPNKFTRLYFVLADGGRLYFNDMRKFGWVRYITDPSQEPNLIKCGLEPLSRQFTTDRLWDFLKRYPNRPIKSLLLDQSLVAGLGNIYVDESLFAAGLRPDRPAGRITKPQSQKLHQVIKRILRLAISKKGTSFSDYRRADGRPGGFVPYLQVYGRKDQPCKNCGQLIKKIKLASRGTHFCPKCQR